MDVEPSPDASTAVYVANARSNEITVLSIDRASGHLEALQRLAVPGAVTPLAIRPDRQVLYAGLRGDQSSVAACAIDRTTGRLDVIANTVVTDPPMYLATDASGMFLFAASYVGATLSISAICDDGGLEPEPLQRMQTPPQAHGIFIDPSNRFLFVTSLGGNVILQYVFDAATGRATPNSVPFIATPKGSGPRHFAYCAKDYVLYVNGELDGSICSYALNANTGWLTARRCESMLAGATPATPWAAELAITPDGRFLYASERRTNTLAVFELGGEPGTFQRRDIIATEEQPRSFAIDPRGRFLIVAGEKSDSITAYRIDPSTGALAAQQRCPVGEKPTWVSIVDL